MTEMVDHVDEPNPDLDTVQQEHATYKAMPAVPVCVEGPVYVIPQPARSGPTFNHPAETGKFTKPLGADLRRSATHLTSDDDWYYSRGSNGEGVRIAADFILTITHCDEVWVKATQSEQEIGVITEVYAD